VGALTEYMSLASLEDLFRSGWDQLAQPSVWVAVVQIIWINVLLSGDNAVVIALACRGLPPRERMWGMIIGAGVASLLLIFFTGVVSILMTLPYLRLASAIALIWIAVKLLAPESHDAEDTPEAVESLWRAVRVVVIADMFMSLDNVVAVAGVAKGEYVLLAIGLAISIPMVIAGSAIILALLERFPVLVWGGAAVLGWVAGDLFASDPVVSGLVSHFDGDRVELVAQAVGALLVLIAGFIWRRSYGVAMTEN
jgi:YjbE family integral membrane protein